MSRGEATGDRYRLGQIFRMLQEARLKQVRDPNSSRVTAHQVAQALKERYVDRDLKGTTASLSLAGALFHEQLPDSAAKLRWIVFHFDYPGLEQSEGEKRNWVALSTKDQHALDEIHGNILLRGQSEEEIYQTFLSPSRMLGLLESANRNSPASERILIYGPPSNVDPLGAHPDTRHLWVEPRADSSGRFISAFIHDSGTLFELSSFTDSAQATAQRLNNFYDAILGTRAPERIIRKPQLTCSHYAAVPIVWPGKRQTYISIVYLAIVYPQASPQVIEQLIEDLAPYADLLANYLSPPLTVEAGDENARREGEIRSDIVVWHQLGHTMTNRLHEMGYFLELYEEQLLSKVPQWKGKMEELRGADLAYARARAHQESLADVFRAQMMTSCRSQERFWQEYDDREVSDKLSRFLDPQPILLRDFVDRLASIQGYRRSSKFKPDSDIDTTLDPNWDYLEVAGFVDLLLEPQIVSPLSGMSYRISDALLRAVISEPLRNAVTYGQIVQSPLDAERGQGQVELFFDYRPEEPFPLRFLNLCPAGVARDTFPVVNGNWHQVGFEASLRTGTGMVGLLLERLELGRIGVRRFEASGEVFYEVGLALVGLTPVRSNS